MGLMDVDTPNTQSILKMLEPIMLPMSDGFKSNVEYFKLGFLDKNAVSLGRQFKEL